MTSVFIKNVTTITKGLASQTAEGESVFNRTHISDIMKNEGIGHSKRTIDNYIADLVDLSILTPQKKDVFIKGPRFDHFAGLRPATPNAEAG